MSWQTFEKKIREVSSYRWNCNAITETLAGVKCDCVLKPKSNYYILVEITEEHTLHKVRTDITKLNTVKLALLSQNIYSECYIVLETTPTDSMRAAGKEQCIQVESVGEYFNEYFEYRNYVYARKQKSFGSLINIETGEPENNAYIGVTYYDKKSGKDYRIEEIIALLKKGKRIVLKGDFGLGKSRCIKKVFDELSSSSIVDNPYGIAINLRDHWGAKRAGEILSRHFEDLGLDAKNFIKSFDQSNVIYLLDGFDEIGTQSWSSDVKKMQHIRAMSVSGIKDLIEKVKGGILITGREYYFNSDSELLSCLGLSKDNTIILECPQEFTDSELVDFIKKNTPDTGNDECLNKLPAWFPRRPLVIQLLLKYASDVFSIEYALDDICGFWYAFLSKICDREAKIYPALNPEIIKNVLLYLANFTRKSASGTGPIAQIDLSNAFIAAAGFAPNDESSIMLQRLPSLARISADSPNRQFIDSFILNGLRAESIIKLSKEYDQSIYTDEWRHPLNDIGLNILTTYISKNEENVNRFLGIARQAATKNKILASDIVCAICLLDIAEIDFNGLTITDGHFFHLSFEGKVIKRLSIKNSIIEKLDLTNSKLADTVTIEDSIISTIYGISSIGGIPSQLVRCDTEDFEPLATTALIKKARLSESQKLFVEMMRKIYFQPGAGRKEAALLRGMGASANKQLGKKILNKLLDEDLVTRHKGDEGYIYSPVRRETERVKKMLTDLTLSEDPVWKNISALSY